MSLARVTVSGVLTSQPEKRFTNNNVAVTSFTISVDNAGFNGRDAQGDATLTVKITCWRNLAESVPEQLSQGDTVVVEGKLMMNQYQTPEGVTVRQYEVEASSLTKFPGAGVDIKPAVGNQFNSDVGTPVASPAPAAVGAPAAPAYAPQPSAQPQHQQAGFPPQDTLTEDDIPF